MHCSIRMSSLWVNTYGLCYVKFTWDSFVGQSLLLSDEILLALFNKVAQPLNFLNWNNSGVRFLLQLDKHELNEINGTQIKAHLRSRKKNARPLCLKANLPLELPECIFKDKKALTVSSESWYQDCIPQFAFILPSSESYLRCKLLLKSTN